MARGRAATYDDQREAILARAAELFAHRGYAATTMNDIADACGLSKATLYHYVDDKYALLVSICEDHVDTLRALVDDVDALRLPPEARLRELIRRFVQAYAGAQHAHRVLTEDVRFLDAADRERVLGTERELVAGIARTVAAVRPELAQAHLAKPLTMLLFGMINWMFTWVRPDGPLDHDALAPIVADLFLGGLPAVKPPQPVTA
ncbi:TetR/AcrR family transcriptional regulator [Azohydromonas sediminis]|uniref:TetR/AcrR family transcriptional regulator n=1 Tax=Azohydromonas sediminis TaxID=2259674 RepID=UPI000E64CA2B|nr:TetR/AcrR family transcriptional regulator [Azohydromonas sediminis]